MKERARGGDQEREKNQEAKETKRIKRTKKACGQNGLVI